MKSSTLSSFLHKVLLLAFLCGVAPACSNDDDSASPASAYVELPSNVVGKFTGDLSYTKPGTMPIANSGDGTATLTKTGDKTYSVSFSDGVPTITGLRFQSGTTGSYATVSSDGSTAGMTLSSNNLAVSVTKGSETWGFNGDK